MSLFSKFAAPAAQWISDYLGDEITYIPQGQASVKVLAVITQPPPEKTGATSRSQVSRVQVQIAKNDYPSRPIPGGDKVVLPGSSKSLTVQKIENENDPMMWNLFVE